MEHVQRKMECHHLPIVADPVLGLGLGRMVLWEYWVQHLRRYLITAMCAWTKLVQLEIEYYWAGLD